MTEKKKVVLFAKKNILIPGKNIYFSKLTASSDPGSIPGESIFFGLFLRSPVAEFGRFLDGTHLNLCEKNFRPDHFWRHPLSEQAILFWN